MRPLTVLCVNHTSEISGAERSLLDLLRGLPDGVRPVVACPPGDLADAVRSAGVEVRSLRGTDGSLRLHPLHSSRAAIELSTAAVGLRRLARRVAADLIHANSIRAGLIAAIGRRPGGPPVLTHIRDRLPPGRVADLSLRAITAGTDAIVANSTFTAARLPAAGRAQPAHVVSNPVDLDRFDPATIERTSARAALDLADDGTTVLTVIAQLTPWKGQDDAIRATAALRAQGQRVRLLIVGEATFVSASTRFDNRAYVLGLRRLVDELGLGDAVRFLGQRDDIARVLGATDILLVPSWEEPFGRTVIEGMAMGVTVVATEVGGPAEILTDGEDGLLVTPRRPELWAAALTRLLADRQLRERLAAQGRRTALDRYGLDRHVAAIVGLYERLARG